MYGLGRTVLHKKTLTSNCCNSKVRNVRENTTKRSVKYLDHRRFWLQWRMVLFSATSTLWSLPRFISSGHRGLFAQRWSYEDASSVVLNVWSYPSLSFSSTSSCRDAWSGLKRNLHFTYFVVGIREASFDDGELTEQTQHKINRCSVVADRLCDLDLEVRVRFPALPDFLRSSGSRTGSTQPREYNWGATWKRVAALV
jgi:hypothetical protein